MRAGFEPVLRLPCYGILAISALISCINGFPRRLSSRLWLPLVTTILLGSYIAIRALMSPVEYIARADLHSLLAAAILYLAFALRVTSVRLRTAYIVALFVLAILNVIVGAIQFFEGKNYMLFTALPRGDYGSRASGLFGCPNHLAGFLEVVMMFALSLTFWGRNKLGKRLMYGYMALICGAGIVMTGSRGGYASVLFGILTFGVLSLWASGTIVRKEVWYLVLAGSIVAALTIAFAVRSVFDESRFLQYRVTSTNMDVPYRIATSRAAIQQFKLNPIFGTGSGTYLYYGRQFRLPLFQTDPEFAHDDYAQLLGEYGIVGAVGVLLFVASHIRSGWVVLADFAREQRTAKREATRPGNTRSKSRSASVWRTVAGEPAEHERARQPKFAGSNSIALTLGAVAAVATYVPHSLVDFNLHIPANALLLASVFGILANPVSNANSEDSGEGRFKHLLRHGLRLLAPALGAWLGIVALPTLPAEYYRDRAKRVLADWRLIDSEELASEAEGWARKGVKIDPGNPELYYCLGESLVARADLARVPADRRRLYEGAIGEYRSAIKLAPQDVRYLSPLAAALDSIEQYDEAEAVFQRVLELDPKCGRRYAEYGMHLYLQRRLPEAEAALSLATESDLASNTAAEILIKKVREELKAQNVSKPK